ncbi:putative nuclease HARBI1 [Mya arenaria]|uniref:putative nuclease HARBI1 n=1 Tax=Mya arenaria TaxID=6604 RepID=UPI0022E4CDF0|nr:putative nuclease HARBI1 [Mya arenaria]
MAAIIGCLVNIPRKNREFRVINLNENLNDEELRRKFRFGRRGIEYLADLLREDLARETDRSCSLSVEEQVCIALRYYASGSCMQVVGDTHGRHKSIVCRVVDKVTKEIVKRHKQYIKWPVDEATKRRVKSDFSNIAGFPGVIGCVDGSHVRLIKPSPDQERGFINRKGFPSINVMAVCDAKGKFTFINAQWPGSAHGSFIFRTSTLGCHMERNHRGLEDGIILGDSGYACSRYLMTPYRVADTNQTTNFNRGLCRTRVLIECTFGRWKRRFGILHGELRKTPAKASEVIVACAVLHNIAIMLQEPGVPDDDNGDGADAQIPYAGRETGFLVRDHLAQVYF